MNSYDLSRKWFDWTFENPERINPNHTALYFFIIEHCNRLGWKKKFGLPTTMAKEAIGIRSYNTYINTLNDLVEFGFINIIEKSKNQYSSNIVAISNFDKAHNKAHDKALDKALIKHSTKQRESNDSINKQETIEKETIEQKTIIDYEFYFKLFWEAYDKKEGKSKSFEKFKKINPELYDLIIDKAAEYKNATPDVQFRKHPLTWLNGKHWEDELVINKTKNNETGSKSRERMEALFDLVNRYKNS
jgi:hypothetical protein